VVLVGKETTKGKKIMAEKLITYEVSLIVNHYNTQHIKKFENALYKMVNNTSGFSHTEVANVKVKK
jgi:nucleoside diphosphate kinase